MFWRVPGARVGPEAEGEGDSAGDFSSEEAAAQEGREAGLQGEAPAGRGLSASLGLVTGQGGVGEGGV